MIWGIPVYRIAQLLYGFALCGFHLIFGLDMAKEFDGNPEQDFRDLAHVAETMTSLLKEKQPSV